MLKVLASYLEKQKSFIPKKSIFWAVVNIKTKKLCLLTQFSRRFWTQQVEIISQLAYFYLFLCACTLNSNVSNCKQYFEKKKDVY